MKTHPTPHTPHPTPHISKRFGLSTLLFLAMALQVAIFSSCKREEIVTDSPSHQVRKLSINYDYSSDTAFHSYLVAIKDFNDPLTQRLEGGDSALFGQTLLGIQSALDNLDSNNLSAFYEEAYQVLGFSSKQEMQDKSTELDAALSNFRAKSPFLLLSIQDQAIVLKSQDVKKDLEEIKLPIFPPVSGPIGVNSPCTRACKEDFDDAGIVCQAYYWASMAGLGLTEYFTGGSLTPIVVIGLCEINASLMICSAEAVNNHKKCVKRCSGQ